ncbi:MAG TPA: secretin N-terminal domain-containing protein [Thermoanaerobaculia bacterium]|nr:secretin N-terminal domain-containing protein [Thermoanaerobaculia bacterium]
MKRLLTALCAFLLICGTAMAEPRDPEKALTVRAFTFKHKDADKAAAAIKTLLSADGSVTIQPSTNALLVTDHAENLKAITKTLAEFDAAAAQPFRLQVRIVSASRAAGAARVPANLADIKEWLSVTPYQSFEKEGEADVQGKEGAPGVVDMPSGYRAEFKFGDYDPASDSIHISDLQISKVQKDQLTSLLKTTLNLRIGQTYLLGAARSPESKRALMIVLVARR